MEVLTACYDVYVCSGGTPEVRGVPGKRQTGALRCPKALVKCFLPLCLKASHHFQVALALANGLGTGKVVKIYTGFGDPEGTFSPFQECLCLR